MNRLLVGFVALTFVFVGCKKPPAPKTDKEADKAAVAEKVADMARVLPGPRQRPRTSPKAAPPAFRPLKKLAALIEATAKCTEPVHHKCAEAKRLDQYVKDLWMNKVRLSDADKIRGFKTVSILVGHKNKKIRNFAAGVLQLNPFGLRDQIAKTPGLIEKIYIVNLLEALPNLETFRSGWLMSYIPHYAPAYGLLDLCFTQADKCKNKKDLYRRILKGMTKYARLKPFDITKKYAKDHSAEGLPWSRAALSGLQSFPWKKKDAVRICPWAATLLPAKIPPETMQQRIYETMLHRYVDVLKRCKVLETEEHLEVLTKLATVTEMLKNLTWRSKDYSKTVGTLVDHFRKRVMVLKKKKEKKKKID
jgi:hypothetical protein